MSPQMLCETSPVSELIAELQKLASQPETIPDDYLNRLAKVTKEVQGFNRRKARGQHSLPFKYLDKVGFIPEPEDEGPMVFKLMCKPAEFRRVALKVSPVCTYCGCRLDAETATADHVIPSSKGGQDEPANLVLACSRCNGLKADQTPQQWAARILSAFGQGGAA